MHRFKFLSLLLAASAAVGACSDDGGEGFNPSDDADVRVLHAAPGAPILDVLLTDTQVADNLAYGQSTSYTAVPGGTQTLVVGTDVTGEATELLNVPLPVTAGAGYTVVVGGQADGLVPYVIPDDHTAPPTGQAKFRVLHFAASAPGVDVYVTAPGADIGNATPTFSAVAYGDPTSYATLPAGTYQVWLTNQLSTEVAIDAGTIQLGEGDIRTAIAIDAPAGGAPYSAVLLDDRRQ